MFYYGLATLWLVQFAAAGIYGFNLTIVHTNDIHSRIEETNTYSGKCSSDECYGGFARLKTKIEEVRSEHPNTILLDAGDQSQGTLWYYHYGARAVAHFMNLLGYDAMAMGNHEFDNGIDGLLPLLNNASFSLLSANINGTAVPEFANKVHPRVTLKVGGEKIGLVGYTTQETPLISNPGGLLVFNDEIEAVQREVDVLLSEGINKIIALGHAGITMDKRIASEVSGLDIIIGGHSNTFLYTGSKPSIESPVGSYPLVVDQASGDRVLVVQDYAFGKYLGFLQVTFDDQGRVTAYGGNPILLDGSVQQDPVVASEVSRWALEVEALKNEVIGRSMVYLEGDRAYCRQMECNLGNLMTDAMVHQNLKHADSIEGEKVFIGIWNGGAIRASLEQGDISIGDILSVTPFRNTLDTIQLKGEYLLAVLEHSVSAYEEAHGRFLQVAGLRVTYDVTRPVGDRVISVTVKCATCRIPEYRPLNMTEMYSMITSSFLIEGGDSNTVLKEHAQLTHVIGDLDSDVVTEYVKASSPIAHGLERRITLVTGTLTTTTSTETPETTTKAPEITTQAPATTQKPIITTGKVVQTTTKRCVESPLKRENDLNLPIIIGLSIGGFLLLLALIVACMLCRMRQKSYKHDFAMKAF